MDSQIYKQIKLRRRSAVHIHTISQYGYIISQYGSFVISNNYDWCSCWDSQSLYVFPLHMFGSSCRGSSCRGSTAEESLESKADFETLEIQAQFVSLLPQRDDRATGSHNTSLYYLSTCYSPSVPAVLSLSSTSITTFVEHQ